jgi:hypothetical protein
MTYYCPNCESTWLLVSEHTLFEINTGEFYCHSVKMHDNVAHVKCQSCNWTGKRQDLLKSLEGSESK